MTDTRNKSFPVTWDQFHRDSRALAWRLSAEGPFEACVAITRGGLVPAAIVARELNIRTIECVSVKSYDHQNQGGIQVLKPISPDIIAAAKAGKKVLIVDDLVDTGATARVVRDMPSMCFGTAAWTLPASTSAAISEALAFVIIVALFVVG